MRAFVERTKYFVLGAALAAMGLWGLAVTLPHTFSPGDEIKSSEMNANFQALKDAVDALEAKLEAVSASQLALPSKAGKLGYAWITSSGTVGSPYTFNSSGGTITATHTDTGKYRVTFEGLGGESGGHVQVSAYGSGAFRSCHVVSWNDGGSADVTINVRCYDASGTLADGNFTVLYLR